MVRGLQKLGDAGCKHKSDFIGVKFTRLWCTCLGCFRELVVIVDQEGKI